MALFNFNMLGFAYEQGVDSLETGFTTAAAGLVARREDLHRALEAYEANVAAGGQRVGEEEDGHWLWEQDQLLTVQIEDAAGTLQDLRKAYVLAAYHHWERTARQWTRVSGHAKHDKLVAATLSLGYPVDERLAALRDLANTLKHNSTVQAAKLALSWPELLKVDPAHRPDLDWYSFILLDDRHVCEACEIIRRSGPNVSLLPVRVEPEALKIAP